jgi:hypothetical protein
MEKKVGHTPFPWAQYDDGGALPGVYKRKGGFRYGDEGSDWVWGPDGPGYGVVADCSPHDKATDESRANAKLISALPFFVLFTEITVSLMNDDDPRKAEAIQVLKKVGRLNDVRKPE